MANLLFDYQTKLNEELEKLKECVLPLESGYPAVAGAMRRVQAIYDAKLKDMKPQIMIYGIYNAGKSSIINELLGSDDARVADIPTTDSVDYYEWNGYQIADTPGVGAPIEHEMVTQDHLRKADVVIFVMSTTGSNEKRENYTRMKDIADAGKKIIIVLNDKNGDLGVHDDVILEIKRKVAQNMKTVGIADVENKYCFVTVNAARAKRGRTENKLTLLAKSNIEELSKVILAELKKTNGFNVLRNGVFEIEKEVDCIVEAVEQSDKDTEIDGVNEILASLRNYKRTMRNDINAVIENKTERFGQTLPDIIWEMKDNESAIQDRVQQEIEKTSESVDYELERLIQDMQDDLAVEIKGLVDRLQKMQISVDTDGLAVSSPSSPIKTSGNGSGSSGAEEIGRLLSLCGEMLEIYGKNKKSLMLPEAIKQVAVSQGVNAAVVKGTEMALKKAGSTAAGKAVLGGISKIVPIPLVPQIPIWIIPLIIDIAKWLFHDDSEEKRRLAEAQNEANRAYAEAIAQARQELRQKCLYMGEDLSDQLKRQMGEIINNIIGEFEAVFTEKRNAAAADLEAWRQQLATLRAIADDYHSIRVELGA